jgi:chitin synthase
MILYIIAIPVFSFALPLYSFWHMDDFSWGNTRVVTGEKGQKIVISDEGKFDPASIPRKKWEDYQAELWEAQTQRGYDDTRSEVSGFSYGTKSYAHTASEFGGYGQQPMYSQSRSMSQMEIPMQHQQGRMSVAASDVMSQQGGYNPEMEISMLDLPSDDAILAEIREILRTADLMTVTKKSVKAELERKFGVSLDAKRAYVNSGQSLPLLLATGKYANLHLATEAILGGNL